MLPQLNVKPDSITMMNTFMGLNKNLQIEDGEFADMKNITNDHFPVLANRKKRGILKKLVNPQGVLGGKYLAYVDDNKLYYDEFFICDLKPLNVERQMVMMGAYLVVFPDGLIYNTYDEEISYIENEVHTHEHPTFTLCKLDGTNYDDSNTITSDTEPSDKTKFWLDTSASPVVLKMYSENLMRWVSVGTTYVKVEASGIGVGFSAYDSAKFSGVDKNEYVYNNWDFNQTNIIYDRGDDFLVIAGLINKVFTNSQNITVKREMPEMDFVCEQNNRIWGCSSKNHEIYACKQGDPKNWNSYAGLDSDSYAATVGTQTDFTGAISYGGYVLFFKEDGYHKLYGTKPSNYELQWKAGRGVQKGSEKSLCIVNDALIFKSRDAVCIYDGSGQSISQKLGTEPYFDAVGGAYRDKYFVSMRDENYARRLYVFDMTKGTWVVEDNLIAKFIVYADNGMFIIDYDNNLLVVNNERIYTKLFPKEEVIPNIDVYPGNSANGTLEETVEWSFTTGDIGMTSPFHKYIKRLNIRMWLDTATKMKIEVMYDSTDAWEEVMTYYATRKRSVEIPIPVIRCDHMRIRFSGFGDMRLFSIAKVSEEGSGM